jgi:hypothetical protein
VRASETPRTAVRDGLSGRESARTRPRRGASSGLPDRSEHPCLRIGWDRFARFPLPRACRSPVEIALRRDVRRNFFAVEIARASTARRLHRDAQNAVKSCARRCARIFRHGRNAQFAMVSSTSRKWSAASRRRHERARDAALAARRRGALRRGGRARVHVSLIRKLFFSFCCSNRNAVTTIRVVTDATPPAQPS